MTEDLLAECLWKKLSVAFTDKFRDIVFPTNTNLIQFLLLNDIHASADSKAKLFLNRISHYLKCVHHIASVHQIEFFFFSTHLPRKCRTNANTMSKKKYGSADGKSLLSRPKYQLKYNNGSL